MERLQKIIQPEAPANDDDTPPPPQAFEYYLYDDLEPVSASLGPRHGPTRPIVFGDPFRRSPTSMLGKRSSQTATRNGRPMILGHPCSPRNEVSRRDSKAADEALAKMRVEEALARAMELLPRATDTSAMDMGRLQKIFNGTFRNRDIQPPQPFDIGLGDDGEQGYCIPSLAAYVPTTSFRRDGGGGSVADSSRAEALAKMRRAEEEAASRPLEEALARAPPGIQRLREMIFGCQVRPRSSDTTVAPDDTDQLAASQLLAAAEDLWASGDLASARRLVRMAMDVEPFSGFPEVRRARVAYDVLASKSSGKDDHDYAVLGVAVPAHGDVNARYEELCAVLGGDETGDLAVACALQLVNMAFARITDMED